MDKSKNSKRSQLVVSKAVHRDLVRLAGIERRNIQDITERLLAPAVKTALLSAKANQQQIPI